MKTDFKAVGEFHEKFGLPSPTIPQEVTPEVRDFRLRFLLEELTELCDGYGLDLSWQLEPIVTECPDCSGGCERCANGIIELPPRQDLPKIADALVDLVYVALGTAHLHGLPWSELFHEVQRANITKERAAADGSNSARKSALDVVKPAGWTGPDIINVLMAAGWPGPKLPLKETP